MAKITNVRTKVKEDNSTLAILTVEGQDNPIFLTGKQIMAACGLKNNFMVLKGADLNVVFYARGELLVNGTEVTDDNKIVKEFDIELPEKLVQIQTAVSFGASLF